MDEKRKRAPIMRTVFSAYSLMFEAGQVRQLIMMGIWLAFGAADSLIALFNKNFLNEAADVLAGKDGAFQAAVFWLVCWGLLGLASNVVNILDDRSSVRMQSSLSLYLREKVLHKVGNVRMSYFDDLEAQKKIRNVKGSFAIQVANVTNVSINILRMAITLVTSFAIIQAESKLIAVVVLVSVFPAILIGRAYTEQKYWQQQSNSFDEQMQRYLALVLTKRKYIKEMRFYQLYDYMENKYDKSVNAVLKEQMKIHRKFFVMTLASEAVTYLGIAVSLVLISIEIFRGKAGIGSFMLVYNTVRTMQGALKQLFDGLDIISDRGRFLEDYRTVMQYDSEDCSEDAADAEQGLEIQFEHVSFAYPGSDREVLKDINVTLHPGEKIAIVGENGSGKTTFVSLMTGLYSPTKGRVLVNGRDISERLSYLRNHISCTTQEFLHLHGTIEDNVRIGDYEHPHTTEEIREALEKADLLSEVDEYPLKEQTNLGNLFKDSTDLSGGQWQKLAMARNLIKKDAQLMILDEPTAALDPLAESKLYHDFSELTQDKGVVLISHRLGATRLSDRVLVFRDGEIVEQGAHEELLARKGYYTEMYHAQAQWYV